MPPDSDERPINSPPTTPPGSSTTPPTAPFGSPPDETFRLHPLTPIALGGRILGIVAVFALFTLSERSTGLGGGLHWGTFAVYAAIGILVIVRGLRSEERRVGKECRS